MNSTQPHRHSIAVDFDGVIHAYSKGWQNGDCYDFPMPGAIDALKKLMKRYNVFVLSTRQPVAIRDWFAKWAPEIPTAVVGLEDPMPGPFWNQEGVLGITQRKLAAVAYIDDRGIRFTNWNDVLNLYT